MRKTLILMGIMLMTAKAFAAPIGVQDINVGMTKTETIEKLKARKIANCNEKRNYCTESAFIKRPVFITYSFGETTGKLESIHMWFYNKFYDGMLDGLKEKYSKPTTTRKTLWQNKAGATFDNIETIWQMPEGDIVLSTLGQSVDKGEITMISKSVTEQESANKREFDKKQPGF